MYFNCIVPNPFIQVDGIERTSERGIDGYIEDLSAVGIEAKGVNSNTSFISTICVNRSSSELKEQVVNTTCQEIVLDRNFQPFYTPRFTFTLIYQSKL